LPRNERYFFFAPDGSAITAPKMLAELYTHNSPWQPLFCFSGCAARRSANGKIGQTLCFVYLSLYLWPFYAKQKAWPILPLALLRDAQPLKQKRGCQSNLWAAVIGAKYWFDKTLHCER